MPPRRCLGCGTPTTSSRCPTCRSTQRAKYAGAWPAHSRTTITAHIEAHGHWCPGWHAPAHPSTDLTLDHGPPERVLCRACNSRKKANGHG